MHTLHDSICRSNEPHPKILERGRLIEEAQRLSKAQGTIDLYDSRWEQFLDFVTYYDVAWVRARGISVHPPLLGHYSAFLGYKISPRHTTIAFPEAPNMPHRYRTGDGVAPTTMNGFADALKAKLAWEKERYSKSLTKRANWSNAKDPMRSQEGKA